MTLTPEQKSFRDDVAAQLGLDAPSEIWSSAPGDAWQLRNRLWQGEPRSKRFPLGLVFIPAGQAETAIRNSAERLSPPPNGFDAIAVVEKSEGRWKITSLVEPVGGTLGWRIRALAPDVRIVHVPPTSAVTHLAAPGARTQDVVANVTRQFEAHPNVILQGPPGTGKTFVALQVAQSLAQGSDLGSIQFSSLLQQAGNLTRLLQETWLQELPLVWDLVQMHPSYTYDDFVRGRILIADDGGSRFQSIDRIIPQMAAIAAARGEKPTLLIIDEINRCNLANVLGEVISVLDPDKRGTYPVRLQYPPPPGAPNGEGTLLTLPKKLLFLATMNTADRSIALIDFAIRRRFRFIDLLPDRDVIADHYKDQAGAAERILAMFDATTAVVSRQFQIGHSYFLVELGEGWADRIANRFMYEVLPLLREYLQEGHITGSAKVEISANLIVDLATSAAEVDDTALRDAICGFLGS